MRICNCYSSLTIPYFWIIIFPRSVDNWLFFYLVIYHNLNSIVVIGNKF